VIGIGGGGDVVGALAVAELLRKHGVDSIMGGVTWERFPVDPQPGPRTTDEIVGGRQLTTAVVLADADTHTSQGARFAEARLAALLDEPTVLVDPNGGPGTIADGLAVALAELDCDLLAAVDVGGDALADGSEPGLASPLCDAVLLAAVVELQRRGHATVGAVFGPACDGELTGPELLGRVAVLAANGALLGVRPLDEQGCAAVERASTEIPTEASQLPLRCARGEIGETTIRGGRRTVFLSPLGALTFYFDPRRAELPLAAAVAPSDSLDDANRRLAELGVSTELDYERSRAKEG
jgi:hypothetical protein